MITRSALDRLQQAGWSIALLQQYFDNPQTFVIGNMPAGWSSIATLSDTSYNGLNQQFTEGKVPASIQAIVYDNEDWQFTPKEEQINYALTIQQVATLVHLHHKLLIATPAVDLVQVLDPAYRGNRYDRFLSLGIIRESAAAADIVEIQAQGSEAALPQYVQFVSAAVNQAKSANPKVLVFAGLSTNPNGQRVTGNQLNIAFQATRSIVSGYWLNIPSDQSGYCPRCGPAQPNVAIDFLQQIGP
jgi:hypothetical protein